MATWNQKTKSYDEEEIGAEDVAPWVRARREEKFRMQILNELDGLQRELRSLYGALPGDGSR